MRLSGMQVLLGKTHNSKWATGKKVLEQVEAFRHSIALEVQSGAQICGQWTSIRTIALVS